MPTYGLRTPPKIDNDQERTRRLAIVANQQIGPDVLPKVNQIVDDLGFSLGALEDAITAQIEKGCSLETAKRLLKAHDWLFGYEWEMVSDLQCILYGSGPKIDAEEIPF